MRKYLLSEKMKYIFWGVATTIVYLIVRLISMKIFDDTMLPVLISQTLTIIFAFVVNKLFVFTTKQTNSVFVQFIRFLWGRLFVAGIDFFLTYVMIEKYSNIFIHIFFLNQVNFKLFPFSLPIVNQFASNSTELNSFLAIILIQVLSVIVNYLISKFMIFN